MALRGRSSSGHRFSKYGNARSAQSAAQIANDLWSVLFASSAIPSSNPVTAILRFFMISPQQSFDELVESSVLERSQF
jgi:hypothetical protein